MDISIVGNLIYGTENKSWGRRQIESGRPSCSIVQTMPAPLYDGRRVHANAAAVGLSDYWALRFGLAMTGGPA